MKRFTATALIYFLLLSCSGDAPKNTVSELYTDLETADSLYEQGNISDAELIWECILKKEPDFEKGSVFILLMSTLLQQKETNLLELEKCDEYIYSCLAQYDALESLYANEDDNEKRIGILQQVFNIASRIDEVSEYYIQIESEINQLFFRPRHSRSRYTEYIKKANPRKKDPDNAYMTSAKKILKHLYNRKWSIMNSLLIEMDNKYGYDTTFNYFDSIFVHHGGSAEEYTKALFKAYMSFSGKPEYEYNSGMDYDTFKSITKENGSWLVTKIINESFIFQNKEMFLNNQNCGFVLKYDNEYIYNPTIIDRVTSYSFESNEVITMNEARVSEIKLLEGHDYTYPLHYYIEIDKPLLYAMLLKHGKSDMVTMLANSRQQQTKDGFVRKGPENGYMKTVYYDSNQRIMGWNLHADDGTRLCDSLGTHKYVVEYHEDSTVHYYYDKELKPKRNGYAKMVEKQINSGAGSHTVRYYYDWGNYLQKKYDDPICTYYCWNENHICNKTVDVDHSKNMTQVTFILGNNLTPFSKPQVAREIHIFDNRFPEESEYGLPLEIHRVQSDGSYYSGNEVWAKETFHYDKDLRLSERNLYNCQGWQGKEVYSYMADSVTTTYYDNMNVVTKVKTTKQ